MRRPEREARKPEKQKNKKKQYSEWHAKWPVFTRVYDRKHIPIGFP